MPKFRKKPVVIEAEQFWPEKTPWPEGVIRDRWPRVTTSWRIETLEGSHVVTPGDWIITGVKGERYPCKPDIFEASYDPLLEAAKE